MASKMKIYCANSCLAYLFILISSPQVLCNPLSLNPMFAYPSAFQPAAMQAPMVMNPQFDPYMAMQSQYMLAQPMSMWPYEANRRSLPGMFGKMNDNRAARENMPQNELESDEQRALDGLPPSLMEPDPPSTLTERISESFSAFNEGVKNHFRSISENFSDTIDDIKDVWKPSEKESKKRKS